MRSEHAFKSLCNSVDVDEEFLEILIPYVDLLVAIGVDLSYLPLQEAIEGNISHLESACRAVIGYAGWLVSGGNSFGTEHHATHCFIKALVERWHPYGHWDKFKDQVTLARYVSPYEKALSLIHQLNRQDGTRNWDTGVLDVLSDEVIEQLIPYLMRELNGINPWDNPNQEKLPPINLVASLTCLHHLFTRCPVGATEEKCTQR